MSKKRPAHMLEKKKYSSIGEEKTKVISFMIVFNILMIGLVIALTTTTVYSGTDTENTEQTITQTIMDQVRLDLIPGKNIIPCGLANVEDTINVEDIKTQFAEANYVVEKVENDINGKVGTGTEFYIKGKVYTFVVYGDVNKDSKVNLLDAQRIVEIYLEKEGSELDNIQILAANTNNVDDKINLLDAQRIVELYLEKTDNMITNKVTSINIQAPIKVVYGMGEDLDLTGGKVIVNYENGTKTETEITQQMVKGYDKTLEAQQALTVVYAGKTAKFNVIVKDLVPTSFKLEEIAEKELRPGGDISKTITGLNKSGKEVPLRKADITIVNNNEEKIEVKLIDSLGYEVTQNEAQVSKIQIISKDAEAENTTETINVKVGETSRTISIVLGEKPYVNKIEFEKGELAIKEVGTTYELQGGTKTTTIDDVTYVLIPVVFKDQYGTPIEVKGNEYIHYGNDTLTGLMLDINSSRKYLRTFNDSVFQTFNNEIIETAGENAIEYIGFALKETPTYIAAGTIRVYYRVTGREAIYSDITVSIIEDTTAVDFKLDEIKDAELKPGKEITKNIVGKNALDREIGLKKQYITVEPENPTDIEVQLLTSDGKVATIDSDIVSKIKIISKTVQTAGTTQGIDITVGENKKNISIVVADMPYVSLLSLQGANLTIDTTGDVNTLTGGAQLATVDGVQYVLIPTEFADQYGDSITIKANEYKRYANNSINGFVIDSTTSGDYVNTFNEKIFRNNNGTIVEAMGENTVEFIGFALREVPTYLENGTIKLIYRTVDNPEVTASINVTVVSTITE